MLDSMIINRVCRNLSVLQLL